MDYYETPNDLSIKHEGTYVGYLGESEPKLALIREFYQNEGGTENILCSFKVRNNTSWNSRNESWEDISESFLLDYPQLGAINYEGTVVLLRRRLKLESPTKYRKSLRSDSYSWFDPNMMERDILGMESLGMSSPNNLTHKLGHSIFFGEEYSADKALYNILSNKMVGAAFSELYYFTLNSCNNSISLWRSDNILGTYNDKKELFELENDYFLNDLLNLNAQVEVF